MNIKYLITVSLFLTSCISASPYLKTYDNSKNEYLVSFTLGCISYAPTFLLPWNKIIFKGPRVYIYLKDGSFFDYNSNCINVRKIDPANTNNAKEKVIKPKKQII